MEFSLPKAPETIIGIDIDPEAVAVSIENADRAGVVIRVAGDGLL